ncbi:MAG: hypothetical protein ACT4PL_10965, partial [Phycisphaerales bacterium]
MCAAWKNVNVKARGVVAAAALLASAAGAMGQCDVFRTGVPDFDQRRDPLPGNGNTYCVPTSVLNWFAFITNHGFPAVLQGPRDWQSQAQVDFITQQLLILDDAALMNTNTMTGTTHSGAQRGARIWLDNFAPGKFIVESRGASGGYEPSPLEAYLMLTNGSLPAVCFGRYDFTPAGVPAGAPSPRLVRNGGHCTTLTRVYDACTSTPEFWFRDPAGFDGDLNTQSQFVTQHSDLAENLLLIASTPEATPAVRRRWFKTPASEPREIYDGVFVIHPITGLTTGATQGEVSVMGSYNFDTLTAPAPQTYALPPRTAVKTMLFDPARPFAWVFANTSGGDALLQFGLGDGSVRFIRNLPNTGPAIVDRRGEVHVSTTNGLFRLFGDVDGGVTLQTMTQVPLASAMAHDDATGRTMMIANGRLGTVTPGAAAEDPFGYMDEDFPPGVTLPTSPSMAINPVDGSILIAGDDTGPDGILVLG